MSNTYEERLRDQPRPPPAPWTVRHNLGDPWLEERYDGDD